MSREEVRVLVMRVLEEAAFSMRQIAEHAGVGYVTVRQWKTGRRVPDRASRRQLAAALRRKSALLDALADELDLAGDE